MIKKTTFFSSQAQPIDCIYHFLDHILTIEKYYLTNSTTSHSVRNLKASNITYVWLLLGQSKVHNIIKCMNSWILNPLNLEGEFQGL